MQYKIITHVKPSYLASEVETLLEDGWELQGGISISNIDERTDVFAQAMIKHDDLDLGSVVPKKES